MAHKGVIIVKHADRGIPGELLRKVLENNPICFGTAMADIRSDGTPELLLARSEKPAVLKDVLDTVEAFKSLQMIYHFADYPQGFHEDDIQPFTVLKNANGEPSIVAFFDGEYPGYAEEKSVRSDAWFAAQKFLIPTITKYNKMVDGDFNKLIDELRDPTFVNTVNMLSPGRSTVTLFTVMGEVLTYSRANDAKREFGFGWTSNAYGYTEIEKKAESPKTEKKVEAKPNKLAAALKATLTGNKPAPAALPTPEPVKAVAPIIANPGPTIKSLNERMEEANNTVANTGTKDEDFVLMAPPVDCISKNQIKSWYYRHCPEMKQQNTLPEGYKKRPKVPVSKARLAEIAEQDKTRKAENRSTSVPEVKSEVPAFIKKDVVKRPIAEVTPIKSAPVELPEQGEQEPPIMPAAVRQQITENFLKHLDKGSKVMPDPTKLKALETKYPPFTQQMGITIEETLKWDEPDLKGFQEHNPDEFRMLAIEWRNALAAKLTAAPKVEPTVSKPVMPKLNSGETRKRITA